VMVCSNKHTKFDIPRIRGTGGGQMPPLQLREKWLMTRDLLGVFWVDSFLKYKAGSSDDEQEGDSTIPARML
jgi:hypothetical protein